MMDDARLRRMEVILAGFLRYGALVACGWIAIGMGLAGGGLPRPGSRAAAWPSGSCCSSRCRSLPVLRVALSAAVFLCEGNYLFAAISSAVLAIIVLGLLMSVGFD
jgi:hypothetical protein